MPEDRATLVAELFKCAVERKEAQWSSFLDEACHDDTKLRREVESLLRFSKHNSDFLEQPDFPAQFSAEPILPPGQVIASYRIVSHLASGGMGDVYLAIDEKLARKVALKVIRPGLATEGVMRRFRREEQILAALNHPHIAHLYGADISPDGFSYFIMEYVEGIRIDTYCNANNLSIRERLLIFRKVCGAVHFAHQHLVIHRDIKPSNILVRSDGEPKLLDFGIAKLLSEDSLQPDRTITMGPALTPAYASPEHARGGQVTTASDVYSLGVLLYQLLTGRRPYRIRFNRPEEVARVIIEQEPIRPSAVAKEGGANAITRGHKLRGDLDNIVLMALRKEPERRYSSAAQFSEDIRRHLQGLPVVAHKDTLRYRTRKFAARHSPSVATAALVVLALIGGVIAFASEARIAATQRDKALLAKNKAERLAAFLDKVFLSSDRSWAGAATRQGRNLTLDEAVEQAARSAEKDLADQPDTLAKLQRTIGNSYRVQGKYELAEHYLRNSLDNYRKAFGSKDPEVIQASWKVGQNLVDQGRHAEAEPLLREALAFYRHALHPGDDATLKPFAGCLNDLAYLLRLEDKAAESEALLGEALQYGPRWKSADRIHVALNLGHLGLARFDRGDLTEAESAERQAIEEFRRLPNGERLEIAPPLFLLGLILNTKGDYVQAESLVREGLAVLHRLVGDEYFLVAIGRAHLATVVQARGRTAEALQLAGDAVSLGRRVTSPGYPFLAGPITTLGSILTINKEPEVAEPYLREGLSLRQKIYPRTHWSVCDNESRLGQCLAAQGKLTDAEPLLVGSYQRMTARLGKKDPRTIEALERIVGFYQRWQRPELVTKYQLLLEATKPGS
jgi:serine/threonine-protein kinase